MYFDIKFSGSTGYCSSVTGDLQGFLSSYFMSEVVT